MSSRSRPRRSTKQSISYVEESDSASDDNANTESESESDFSGSEDDLRLLETSSSTSIAVGDLPSATDPPAPRLQVIPLPTQPEILAAKERIVTSSSELQRVEAQYQVIKKEYEDISKKKDALVRSIEEDKELISPIRRLPVEILGLVFIFCTALPDDVPKRKVKKGEEEEECGSPWTLMHVSRTWRSTALYTRQIWSAINMTSPGPKSLGRTARRKAGREICTSGHQLEMALRRVGNGSIDFLISFSNPFDKTGNGGGNGYESRAFKDMFDALTASGKGPQIRHLKLRGNYGRCSETWPVEKLSLINLETFEFNANASSVFIDRLMNSLVLALRKVSNYESRLQSMKIRVPSYLVRPGQGPASKLDFMKNFTFLRNLTNLIFDSQSTHLTWQDMNDFQAALDTATSLVRLEVVSFDMERRVNSVQKCLRLPHVRDLVISEGSVLWQLESARLTHLTMASNSYILAGGLGADERTYLPNLTSLTLATETKSWTDESFKDWNLHRPLHTIDLRFGKFAEQFWDLMDLPAFSDPVVFKLRKLTLTGSRETEKLVEKLRGMHRLEELEIEDVALNRRFFDRLDAGQTEEDGGLFLPPLQQIKIDLERCALRGQDRAIKAAAKKFAQRRLATGLQIRFALRMPGNKGWFNLAG